MAKHITATHATVRGLTRKIGGRGHKLCMNNFFSSPELFDDLVKKQIYCCGKVRPRHATRPKTEDNRTENERRSRKNRGWLDGNSVAVQIDVCMLTNIYNAPAEGNL